MSFVVISLVSLKGTLAFGASEKEVPKVVLSYDWKSTDNSGLSSDLVKAWSELISSQLGDELCSKLKAIYVVSGPGSFTGIRVGAAFAAGLALGFQIPAYSISTFDLFDKKIGIPIRMHKAYETPGCDCASANLDFLFLDEKGVVSSRLPNSSDLLLGVADAAMEYKDWPTIDQLERGLLKAVKSKQPLKPCYGLSPKIFGKRSP